jgi:hypothetical protein
MEWETIKGIAALWGAVLSTLLFVDRVLARPVLRLEPGPDQGTSEPGLTLRVVNPAKIGLLIGHARRFHLRGGSAELGISTRQSPLNQIATNPSPVALYVGAESDQTLNMTLLGRGTWLLVIWWRRPWLLPMWVPAPLIISSDLAEAINDGARR